MGNYLYKLIGKVSVDTPGVPTNDLTKNTIDSVSGVFFGVAASVAVLFMVISGLMMVLSKGNPESIKKAKSTIMYSAIGLLVVLLSFTIVQFTVGSV